MALSSSQNPIPSDSTAGIPVAIRTAFVAYLNEKGYKPRTQTLYQAVVEHFSAKLEVLNIAVWSMSDALVQDFLNTLPVNAPLNTHRAALHRFIEFLDTQRAPPSGIEPASPIDQTLQRYMHYVESVCGLAPKTCKKRLQIVCTFLCWLEQQAVALDTLPIPRFINYFSDYGQIHRPSSTRCVAHVIRHYLRFEQLQGRDTQALIAAVPKVAPWPLSALPMPLDDSQLERLLSVFDLTTPAGQRDFAMARCLLDLGLRASEVTALRLDDIDWRCGCVHIAAGKNRRAAKLPLPSQTGEAIATYLQKGRARSSSRAIFLPLKAPYDTPPTLEIVRGAMRRAYARAGFPKTWTGTHRLRHYLPFLTISCRGLPA